MFTGLLIVCGLLTGLFLALPHLAGHPAMAALWLSTGGVGLLLLLVSFGGWLLIVSGSRLGQRYATAEPYTVFGALYGFGLVGLSILAQVFAL